MYIRKLRFSNVGPYGNSMYEFDFDNGEIGELWQVLGKNGVGKSFFLKIIKLGLYLETDGMLISEVSNDINGDGYIDIVYDSNGHTWRNESVYSKSKLKTILVYKDGNEKPEDFGGNQDTKKHIIEHILDMPYYIFNNAISLSVNDFKSFLSMDAKDTRNIRDRIFGFFIVNEMVEIIRKTLNKHIGEQSEILTSLKNLQESINTTTVQYEDAKKKAEESDASTLKTLNEQLVEYQTEYNKIKGEIDEKQKSVDDWKFILDHSVNEANKEQLESLIDIQKELVITIEKTKNGISTEEERAKILDSEKTILILKETKNRIDKIRDDIKSTQSKFDNLKEQESLAKQNVDNVEKSINDMEISAANHKLCAELMGYINNLHSLQVVRDEYVSKNKELENTVSGIIERKNTVSGEIDLLKTENKQLEERKQLIDSGKCDKCHTDLTTNTFVEEKSKIVERIGEIESTIGNKNTLIGEIDKSIQEINKQVDEVKSQIKTNNESISGVVLNITRNIPDKSNESMLKIRDFLYAVNKDVLVDVAKFTELVTESNFKEYDAEKMKEFSDKLEKLQKEYATINEEYTNVNNDIISKESSVKTLNEQLEGVDDEELKKELQFDDKNEYQTEIDTISAEIKAQNKLLEDFNKQQGSISTQITNTKNSIKPDDEFENMNQDYLQEISGMDTREAVFAHISGVIETVSSGMNELNTKLNTLNTSIISTNTSINNLNKEKDDNQLKSIKAIIDDFQKKYDDFQVKNETTQKKINFIKILEYVLSDECVKAYMLREIVPTINNEIANMLMSLGVNLNVVFNDEFKPTIYRFGNKASLGSISTGQKKMIDESILMSITILILMRYGKFNLVSYDEIFSSLHVTMIPIMLELIKEKLCKKLKLNVILINHSYMSSSYFDRIVHIYHKDNFSFIDIMKPDEFEMMESSKFEEILQGSNA